jgi:hypothetical protein
MNTKQYICFFLSAFVLVVFCSVGTYAKCTVLSLVVDGQVHSTAKQEEVLIRITPNQGKVTAQRTTPQGDGRFRVAVPFSTFVSAGLFGSHNCSRLPEEVEVILLRDGTAQQTLKLSIDHDFSWDAKRGEWQVKVPIVLG